MEGRRTTPCSSPLSPYLPQIMSPSALESARAEGPKTSRLFGYPLHGTYAPFLHNTITRLANVPRKYYKMESTDMDEFLAYLRSDGCCGSAVTMYSPVRCFLRVFELTRRAPAGLTRLRFASTSTT